MISNPNDALEAALALLGFSEEAPAHQRSNLLHAIQAHAVATCNEGLARASEARINLIKSEAAAVAAAKSDEESEVGFTFPPSEQPRVARHILYAADTIGKNTF